MATTGMLLMASSPSITCDEEVLAMNLPGEVQLPPVSEDLVAPCDLNRPRREQGVVQERPQAGRGLQPDPDRQHAEAGGQQGRGEHEHGAAGAPRPTQGT